MSHENLRKDSGERRKRAPIEQSDRIVSYLGVELEKAQNSENAPRKELYKDYIDDAFSLDVQKKAAVSFRLREPLLLEGGTSIGKTTTLKKMAAELGWEVHYCNLNGATDVEDLMGRYLPNHTREGATDSEFVFIDGKTTSGIRREQGKKKLIVWDEYNFAAPNILVRLHEVLDAHRQNGEVVLSEDASEKVQVSNEDTYIVALMNPPGKGYLERQPLDPAQIRRFNYQKTVTELPKDTAAHFTKTLFHLEPQTQDIPESSFLPVGEEVLSLEQLREIPGIEQIVARYNEFHQGAKALLQNRHIAKDQPQRFTYDDREEPRRVRDYIRNFYRGDINETIQEALRYFYAGKVLDEDDKSKLEELIAMVRYTAPVSMRRKSAADEGPRSARDTAEEEKGKVFTSIFGKLIVATGEPERGGLHVGDTVGFKPGVATVGWNQEIIFAESRKIVGFDRDGYIIIQLNGNTVVAVAPVHFESDLMVTDTFTEQIIGVDGKRFLATGLREYEGLRVGQKLAPRAWSRGLRAGLMRGKQPVIKGFTKDHKVIVQSEDGITFEAPLKEIHGDFDVAEVESMVGKVLRSIVFQRSMSADEKTVVYKSSDPSRKIVVLEEGSGRPISGLSYNVRVVADTKPEDPMTGQYIVEIVR